MRPSQQSGRSQQQQHLHKQLTMAQVHVFEPQGVDVYAAQILLTIHFMDICIKARELWTRYLLTPGDKFDARNIAEKSAEIIEKLTEVPFFLAALVMFLRFKQSFSRKTKLNI